MREPCIPTLAGVAILVIARAAGKESPRCTGMRMKMIKVVFYVEKIASTLQALQRILLDLALLVTR